jgi:uncharacterized repeat protein (TIGR01451 family)
VYSTYLGGSSDDRGMSIAVDSGGGAHVTGSTSSANFPIINGLEQQKFGGIRNCPSPDANLTSSLLCRDVFVAKLDTTLTGDVSVAFSTYLGGGLDDVGLGIAVDARGTSYVTGFTSSSDFPMVDPMQSGFGGGFDAFVARIALSADNPDLMITKSHTGDFSVDEEGVYTVIVTNIGTGATSGLIAVTDALPSGLSFLRSTGTEWVCSPSTGQLVTCTNSSSLKPGSSSGFSLVVRVANTAVPAVTNVASVQAPGH